MITLTADANMLAILSQAKGLAEIRDTSGKVIGFYAPSAIKDAQAYANAAAQIDREEIERRKHSKEPGVTHEEIWGRIRLLEAEIARRMAAGEREFTTDEAMTYFRSLRQKGPLQTPLGEGSLTPMETGGCATP